MKNSKSHNHKKSNSNTTRDGHKAHNRMKGSRRGKPHAHKRPLRHGDLKYLVLALIKEAPRHGYDMMTEIETLSKGSYKPSPGVMYPALELIQDIGWATVQDQDGKKLYAITPDGEKSLQDNAERTAKIYQRLETMSQPEQPGETRPLKMALDGLRHDVKSHMREHKGDERHREKLAKIISKARAEVAALRESADQA